jgi:mono/diheme cytochrome c family protein
LRRINARRNARRHGSRMIDARNLVGACLALGLSACTSAPPPATPAPLLGAELGDAGRGRAYADVNCAACHAVSSHQTMSPNPSAPTFESVANAPGMTSIALNAWLHSPHPSMPHLIVDPDEIDNLAAYLAALKHE